MTADPRPQPDAAQGETIYGETHIVGCHSCGESTHPHHASPCDQCGSPEAARRYHAWAAAQPPPADADALRERVLADWADCPHCHHWGHQHRYGVCMVCDKRDQTCGLFALTPPPANADADALREALKYVRDELGDKLEHAAWFSERDQAMLDRVDAALAATQPPAGDGA